MQVNSTSKEAAIYRGICQREKIEREKGSQAVIDPYRAVSGPMLQIG
jgi:hypothetical protein